jgi:hypothetical protein
MKENAVDVDLINFIRIFGKKRVMFEKRKGLKRQLE